MTRELRVAGLMTSPVFLATLAVFCVQLVILGAGWFPRSEVLVPLFVILILQQLSFRVVRVGAADVWRLLPGGFTVFIRALALLVLGLALLVGGFWSWSNGQLAFNSVPFGRMVFCFVFLSTISVLLLVTIRQRRGETFMAAGVFGSGVLLALLFQMFPNPLLWWTVALLFAAGWLFASFGKLPSPSVTPRAVESGATRSWQVRVNSPARNLLQLEGTGPGRLAVAALVIVICALVQHQLHGAGAFVIDDYSIRGTMANWLALIFLFQMAIAVTERARLLWLRIANGRGGVFLAVERAMLVNLASLSLVAWLTTTLLAAWRGFPIQPAQAGLMLICVAASALVPMYFGLIAGTLKGWLAKTPIALLAVVAMAIAPLLWLYALGLRNAGLDAADYGTLAWLTAAILLVRFAAAWRWRHLDWSKIRITSREPWLRRDRNS